MQQAQSLCRPWYADSKKRCFLEGHGTRSVPTTLPSEKSAAAQRLRPIADSAGVRDRLRPLRAVDFSSSRHSLCAVRDPPASQKRCFGEGHGTRSVPATLRVVASGSRRK